MSSGDIARLLISTAAEHPGSPAPSAVRTTNWGLAGVCTSPVAPVASVERQTRRRLRGGRTLRLVLLGGRIRNAQPDSGTGCRCLLLPYLRRRQFALANWIPSSLSPFALSACSPRHSYSRPNSATATSSSPHASSSGSGRFASPSSLSSPSWKPERAPQAKRKPAAASAHPQC
jgi:hypothetical protein